jgi:hypothetical protein
MTAIPGGSVVTVILQGQTTLTVGADTILTNMAPYLQNLGINVLQSNVPISIDNALATIFPANFSATLSLQPISDTDDLALSNAVSQAYFLVTKSAPQGVSVPLVGGQVTGQPGSPSAVQGCNDPNADFITAALCKLQSAGTALLVGLAGVVIIVLLIVAYGPNVKHIAAAA